MKKIFLITLVVGFCLLAKAQSTDDKKYFLSSEANVYSFSTLSFSDPYLSPMTYNGIGIGYSGSVRGFLTEKNLRITSVYKYNFNAGIALNKAYTSDILYLGGNYGWGIEYKLKPFHGLKVQVGGLWDVDLGMKNLERNINNPVNMDLSTNLNLSGLLRYDIPLWHRNFQLQLSFQTPIVGYMFVPRAGASYYEMFELGNLQDAFHFSSIHNKRGLSGDFSIVVPFRRSVWRFGLQLDKLRYKANNMVFDRSNFGLIIGTTMDAIRFGGTKKVVPQNFISPVE